jgi:hypothetical protein
MDLFEVNHKSNLLVVDYFSRFIVVDELDDSTEAQSICRRIHDLFCTVGVPNTVVSDNGPQFKSDRFAKLLRTWDVQHVTSAPRNAQSNGEAERAVRTVKGMMSKNVDLQAALCMYRDTPLANGYSPSQLLNNRSMNSMGIFTDNRVDLKRLRAFETGQREKQAHWYNIRHQTKDRSPIRIQQPVVIRDPDQTVKEATVVGTSDREVVAMAPSGNVLRRNRSHIARAASQQPEERPPGSEATPPSASPESQANRLVNPAESHPTELDRQDPPSTPAPERRTRRGRISKPPARLNL